MVEEEEEEGRQVARVPLVAAVLVGMQDLEGAVAEGIMVAVTEVRAGRVKMHMPVSTPCPQYLHTLVNQAAKGVEVVGQAVDLLRQLEELAGVAELERRVLRRLGMATGQVAPAQTAVMVARLPTRLVPEQQVLSVARAAQAATVAAQPAWSY